MISKSRIGEIMIYMVVVPLAILSVIGIVLAVIERPLEVGAILFLAAWVVTGAFLTR